MGGPGDPIFQQSQLYNQAWCAARRRNVPQTSPCSSLQPSVRQRRSDHVADEGPFAAQLNLTGYGITSFVPGGIWDKFSSTIILAGLLIAAGRSLVTFTLPVALTGPTWRAPCWDSGSYTATQETEVGTFGETVGLDAELTAQINLKKTPDGC